jgi:hypothetical protein
MAIRRWLVIPVVLVGLGIAWGTFPTQAGAVTIGPPARGDVLKWRFKEGESFYQTQTTRMVQDMTVGGLDTKQSQEQTFYICWTPVKKDARGNWIIKQKIEGLRLKIDIAGNKIEYDSTRGNQGNQAANPLAAFYQALLGAEFTLTVTPRLEVLKTEGLDLLAKKLGAANPALAALVKDMLTGCIGQIDPCFGALPGEAKKKGDRWHKRTTLALGSVGTYQTTYQYTYQGNVKPPKNLVTIAVQPTLKYEGPANAGAGALPFKIQGGDLMSTRGHGVMVLDLNQGRIVQATLDMGVEGTLKIDIGGMTTDVKLRQTQKRTDEISAQRWAWLRAR